MIITILTKMNLSKVKKLFPTPTLFLETFPVYFLNRLISLILRCLHIMHMGTLTPVNPTEESVEALSGNFAEAHLPESVFWNEEFILEAVPDTFDSPQGKPRCITYFTFESFNSCVMPMH